MTDASTPPYRMRAQTAKQHLEKALATAQKEGCSVTEGEIAEHHYKLGRILWTMGGSLRDDPKSGARALRGRQPRGVRLAGARACPVPAS